VPDDVYERVRGHFDEAQLVALTFAAVAINAFNRLTISFRVPAGSYQPQTVHA
jgi:alkylhydroperoxidase family enzyme